MDTRAERFLYDTKRLQEIKKAYEFKTSLLEKAIQNCETIKTKTQYFEEVDTFCDEISQNAITKLSEIVINSQDNWKTHDDFSIKREFNPYPLDFNVEFYTKNAFKPSDLVLTLKALYPEKKKELTTKKTESRKPEAKKPEAKKKPEKVAEKKPEKSMDKKVERKPIKRNNKDVKPKEDTKTTRRTVTTRITRKMSSLLEQENSGPEMKTRQDRALKILN